MSRGAELRSLRSELQVAGDNQIRRVVAMVDALPRRGEADTLIAPLRQRLATLRPPRKLSLTRLLFLPLDALVVPPPAWQPGTPGIPRSVMQPLRRVVEAALGPLAAPLEARVAGRTVADLHEVEMAGKPLWAAGALALAASAMPQDWTEATGLRAADHEAIARPVARLLGHAEALRQLPRLAGQPAEMSLAERLMTDAADTSAELLAMMLTLLLAQMTDAGALLLLADDIARRRPGSLRVASERALDFLLFDSGEIAPDDSDLAPATDALRRAAGLLEGVADQPSSRPGQAARVEKLRRQLDETCRQRFETAAALLADPLPDADGRPVDDAEMGAIETLALDLRRLEAVGRRLGGGGFYERNARASVEQLWKSGGLTRVDRVRIAEIMLGAEAALAMAASLPPD